MQPWVANLIGLALGFAIGGEALYIVFATRDAPVDPSAVTASAEAVPPPIHQQPQSPVSQAPIPQPPLPQPSIAQPIELPRLPPPALPQPGTLPAVIYPDQAPPTRTPGKSGVGTAGTGFFVAANGTLLTAAHVVSGCAQTRIASQWVKPAAAETVAIDTGEDIALLRASGVRPPAILSIGKPAGQGGRLFVLGYPSAGGPLIPTEAWAVLENAQLPPAPTHLTDPGQVIWAKAPGIGHGFSGGPMLDPRNGKVVGIVRAMVDSARLHSMRASIPPSGMVIGPGAAPLSAMLRRAGAESDALPVSATEAQDAARRATVHVLCLH